MLLWSSRKRAGQVPQSERGGVGKKDLQSAGGQERKVWAGGSRPPAWEMMSGNSWWEREASRRARHQATGRGPGPGAKRSHGKEFNRAEACRVTAVRVCSVPPSAAGVISRMPLVLRAPGKRRLYFYPHFTDGIWCMIQKCSFLSPRSLEQAGRRTTYPQAEMSTARAHSQRR